MKRKKKLPDLAREEPYTYDEYAELEDDGNRYELVDGRLELMTSPLTEHQLISAELQRALYDTCGDQYVILNAPIDLILSEYEVRQPDLILIRRERFHEVVGRRGIAGIPDVVAEILSPSMRKRDKRDKLIKYARYGIPEYWVIDPDSKSLEQYVLAGDRYDIVDVCEGEERIVSPNASCANFAIGELMARIPEIPA